MFEAFEGVEYAVTADAGQLIAIARRKAKRAADSDKPTAKLTELAGAVSAAIGLEAISKGMQTCAVAQRHFEGYEVKAPAIREEIRIPFYDTQAVIDRYNERIQENDRRDAVKSAKLVEIAKLSAREEWEASKHAAASLLAAVAAVPASKRSKRRGWQDVSMTYLSETYGAGLFRSCKEFHRELMAKAGKDGSPFVVRERELFLLEINKTVAFHTLENAMPKIRSEAKKL